MARGPRLKGSSLGAGSTSVSRLGLLVVSGGVVSAALGVSWCLRTSAYATPEAAMRAFLAHREADAEEQLLDPLLLCRGEVTPLVEQHLASGAPELRPWAAAYLGLAGHPESAELLLRVIADPTEHPQTRAYALASLQRLDPERGRNIAAAYAADSDWLGQVASAITTGTEVPVFERSYLEAFLGWRS